MARILKGDLDDFPEWQFLSNDKDDSISLKNSIDSFISGTNTELEGEVWRTCFGQLQEKEKLLDLRAEIAGEMIDSLRTARIHMYNFMEEFDELDSGNVEEIHGVLNEIKTKIDNFTVIKNRQAFASNNLLSFQDEQALYGQIENIKSQYCEMKKLYDKLEQLDATDSATYNQILSSGKLNSYKNQIK